MTNAYAKYKLQSFSIDEMFLLNNGDGNKILITFLIYEIIYVVLIHQSFLWNVIKLHFGSKDEMFLWNNGDEK